ncbi:Protein kinase domain-containing protein [Fodinibius roseus]|uniref:Protein kinase domain-containing protein n=1 Tax=Fodinibius roseus TaxID=1194090 RepID=A0A1M4UR17_9BACT|nr:protein kinase family protein [Fodinibius roseus]SHE59166.1 Protein kinase domain-containing protein [Fodinibius roseus]
MRQKQQFGAWEVEEIIKQDRVFVVSHPDYEGEYVLKKAPDRGHIRLVSKHEDPEIRSIRLMRKEIRALRRVTDHPNIINMIDYNLEAEYPWHVTERIKPGIFNNHIFRDWPLERLEPDYIDSKINDLIKACGYLHSKGILLNADIEIYLDEDDNFVIGDFEFCKIWDNHHLDTSKDMLIMVHQLMTFKGFIEAARIQKRKELGRQREVEEAHRQAQPSAPRRLVKE